MEKVKSVEVGALLSRSELQSTSQSSRGVPLFDSSDSERLLELCEHLGIGVLGVEGFTLSNGDLCPQMDYIADFSSILSHEDFESKSIQLTRKFLLLAVDTPGLLFEYVLASRTDPSPEL